MLAWSLLDYPGCIYAWQSNARLASETIKLLNASLKTNQYFQITLVDNFRQVHSLLISDCEYLATSGGYVPSLTVIEAFCSLRIDISHLYLFFFWHYRKTRRIEGYFKHDVGQNMGLGLDLGLGRDGLG